MWFVLQVHTTRREIVVKLKDYHASLSTFQSHQSAEAMANWIILYQLLLFSRCPCCCCCCCFCCGFDVRWCCRQQWHHWRSVFCMQIWLKTNRWKLLHIISECLLCMCDEHDLILLNNWYVELEAWANLYFAPSVAWLHDVCVCVFVIDTFLASFLLHFKCVNK